MKPQLLFLLFTIFTCYATAQVIVSNMDSYSVDGHISLLKEEPDTPLPVEKAWESYMHHKFSTTITNAGIVNQGFVKNIYWVAILIQNSTRQMQELESGIANGGIFEVEFYLVSFPTGIVIKKHVTGDTYSSYTRGIYHRHFYFPFSLQGEEKVVIFYRVNAVGNGLLLPFKLSKRHYTTEEDSVASLLYAFFSGWLSFVFMFSFLIFLLTREKVYLWYALYVISSCLFFVADGDFDGIWLYPDWPWLGTINPITYALCLTFFMVLFMNNFLLIKETHKKLFIILKACEVLLVLALGLVIVGYGFLEIALFREFIYYYCFAALMAAWVTQVACIAARIRDDYKPAYFYGFALSGVFIALIIYVLTSIGLVNTAILPSSLYVPFALAIEIIMMSFALVYSYNFYRKKEQELSSALTLQQLDFSEELLKVQESEQKRIAEDLHDELGGNLAVIKMQLQTIPLPDETKTGVLDMIDKASNSTRAIAHNLMPPEFKEANLLDLLQNHVNKINQTETVQFNLYMPGLLTGRFNKHDELTIYRIIMEITRNILRHSKASEATIQLIDYTTHLEIMAEDNGKGFDLSTANGIGLISIRSRVNYLQGILNIDSTTVGTTIMIKIPYKKEAMP